MSDHPSSRSSASPSSSSPLRDDDDEDVQSRTLLPVRPLTDAELAELPPVPTSSPSSHAPSLPPPPPSSSSSSASPSQQAAADISDSASGGSGGEEEEATTAAAAVAAESRGDSASGVRDGSGSPCSPCSASGGPVDAPLLVPEWLPAPPSSSASADEDEEDDVETVWQEDNGGGAAPGSRGGSSDAPTVADTAATATAVSNEEGERSPDDASEAARAASITSEAIDESAWAAEERASAALRQFSTALQSKLVEQLIDDAAVAVGRTLQETVQQHEARVRALLASNRLLDRQLASQEEHMRSLRQDLEDSVRRDLQRVLQVDLRQLHRSSSGSDEGGVSTTPSTSSSSSPPPPPRAGAEEDEEDSGGNGSESSATRGRGRSGAVTVEELAAVYVNERNTYQLLCRDRVEWQELTADLRDRLLAATQETAQLRQEVERLLTTTVDVEEHRIVVQAKEEAEHQCALLQLQLAKQAEEAELVSALLQRLGQTKAPPLHAAAADGDEESHAVTAGTATATAAAADAEPHRRGAQWDLALRELEDQATIAANSRQLREQLASAEAQLHTLQEDNAASVAHAAEVEKENGVLRADLQSMTYRNGVLSQQVASLLVKVERTGRAYRQLQATPAALPPPSAEEEEQEHRPGQHDRRFGASAVQQRSSSSSSSLSFVAHRDASTRPSRTAAAGRASRTAEADRGVSMMSALPSNAARRSAWLDAMWPSTSKTPSSTEVEEGLQQRLRTYATSQVAAALPPHARREVSLRQLGSASLKVQRALSPRVPASAQLSGYALGRPPSYSSVDVASGTVTRRVGAAEVTVRASHDADAPVDRLAATPSAERVQSVDGVGLDSELLRLLDTLDKDESLDRFSVHSVAELVMRNQELVQQLYEATQRAAAAAAEEQQQQSTSPTPSQQSAAAAAPASMADERGLHARLSTTAGDADRTGLPPTLTTDPAELLLLAQTGETDSRKRERAPAIESAPTSAGASGAVEAAMLPAATTSVAVAPAASADTWLTDDASAAVASVVDALVRRRDVRLTAADTAVSQALLKALAAQRGADSTVQRARRASKYAGDDVEEEADASTSSRAMSACLRSLLQLCVRQSAALAEVALTAAEEHHDMQTAVKATWTEAQQALLAALQTSQAALDGDGDSAAAAAAAAATASEMPRRRRCVEHVAGSGEQRRAGEDRRHEFHAEEQVALLQQLRLLLHTAAKKDETLLHVYQAAQARQDARQHQQSERMTRLLLRLERKRRLIAALQQRQQHQHNGSNAATAVSADAVARGSSYPTQLEGESSQGPAAITGFRLSPQPGSPVRRTPPLQPMALPTATLADTSGEDADVRASSVDSGSRHPRHSHQHHHHHHPRPQLRGGEDGDSDSDSDSDDDAALTLDIFRELQQQLALSQANHRSAQEELDAEKAKHTTLLERMWVLEAARDDATAAVARLNQRVSEMLSREAHQAVLADLQAATTSLAARDAELRDAQVTHHELREQVAELTRQAEAERRETQLQHGKQEDAARRQEQRLQTEEGRYHMLNEQLKDVKQYATGLENSVALARRDLFDQQQLVRGRDATIAELTDRLLTRDDVQDLLCRLYPDDSVVQANALLVRRLAAATATLQAELAEARQSLAHTQEALQQREQTVREAVQDRQDAEVRLQDAVARLTALQDMDVDMDGDAPQTQQPADAGSRAAALVQVEEASVSALRQRVRYLGTCVAAQAQDIAVLRAAETSWKAREVDLRRQVEVMSADPVSLCARRYGLSTCISFEAQLAEMQTRLDDLHRTVAALQAEKAAVETTIAECEKVVAAARGEAASAQATVERLTTQLTAATAQCAAQTSAVARLEGEREERASRWTELQRRHEAALRDLVETKRDLRSVQDGLTTTTAQKDQLWRDNNLLISKVGELQQALLQSDAEKLAAREALAQGLSASASSAARRRRGGGDRYRGQSSLTQDLSLSSLSPHTA
ncbi:hypothetical protein NESM_000543500 [Novymonas esmeraldas]|uniref:Uncharacterized protein n=1 Tax=Novymonas esmeraldas TaxID=1808958 RepID=A0AAW0EPJ6_9TRYP